MHRALLVFSVLASACMTRPTISDYPEIQEHYRFRHNGPCNSWLRSFRTGFEYCASPVIEAGPRERANIFGGGDAVVSATGKESGEVTEAALRAHGEAIYGEICVACHQADGKGLPGSFPPLAGAGGYYGAPENMAKIIVHGLNGEIQVLGTTYNGAMPAQGGVLTNYDIAAVATYARTSWGNADGIVTPEQVASVR